MGAEPWEYFVPYRADIAAALEDLKRQEFEAGRYNKGYLGTSSASIEDARTQAGADGTGTRSILDMIGVINTPHEVEDQQYLGRDDGMVAPLSPERLLQLYGTETPSRQMILNSDGGIYEWLDRGIGAFVVVYDGEIPTELYFAGYSFD